MKTALLSVGVLATAANGFQCPQYSTCTIPSEFDCTVPDSGLCTSFDECECLPNFEKFGGECVPIVQCPPNMTFVPQEDGFCCECFEGFEWEDNRCIMTQAPTTSPTLAPSETPTPAPTYSPTLAPSETPTPAPTYSPTLAPSETPTPAPTDSPTLAPSETPTPAPTDSPTLAPSETPTPAPTDSPTLAPVETPTPAPTDSPTDSPTLVPSETPTPAPTSAPIMTLAPTIATPSPTSSLFNNLTCHVWGDPHVDCFNGDQYNVNPQARNNYTVLYQMDDRLVVVAELNQTLYDNNWETYVETVYVWFNNQWESRIRRTDCKPTTPTLFARASAVPTRTSKLEFIFGATEEYLTLNFTCNDKGMDIWVEKESVQGKPDPLAWELAQPGYDGNCLICNSVFYQNEFGNIPRLDPWEMSADVVPLDGRTLRFEDNAPSSRRAADVPELPAVTGNNDSSTSAVTISAVLVVASASMLFALL